MRSKRIPLLLLRGTAVAIGVLALVVISIIATWMWRGGVEGGLIAAARLLQHGPTTVYDYALYPARELRPSERPAPFAMTTATAAPPPSFDAGGGRRVALSDLVAETPTFALLVIKDDAIVYEAYATGRSPSDVSQLFSVSKSILATLIGMAIDDGLITSIDQPVTDFVPELAEHGFTKVTLRQLIDMTSPLDYEENDNPFGLHVLMNYTSRLEDLILRFRLREDAAPAFRYKSGDAALLSLAMQRALGPTALADYAQKRLWSPLGMEHRGVWSLDRAGGMEKAWCCIAATARDLAKLGRLHLHRGASGSQRLLSAAWIEASMPEPPAAGGTPRRYAHGWWPASPLGSDCMASGKDGQYLYIAPAHNALVVRLGESRGGLDTARWITLFQQLAAHSW